MNFWKRNSPFLKAVGLTGLIGLLEGAYRVPPWTESTWPWLQIPVVIILAFWAAGGRLRWVPFLLALREWIEYGVIIEGYRFGNQMYYWQKLILHHWIDKVVGFPTFPWITGPLVTLALVLIRRHYRKRHLYIPI